MYLRPVLIRTQTPKNPLKLYQPKLIANVQSRLLLTQNISSNHSARKNSMLYPDNIGTLSKNVSRILFSGDALHYIQVWLAEPHRRRLVRAIQSAAVEILCDKKIHTSFVDLVKQLNESERQLTMETCINNFEKLYGNYYAVCKIIILLEHLQESRESAYKDLLIFYSKTPMAALNTPSAIRFWFINTYKA